MKIHGGETRCPRARTWRAEPRLVSCWHEDHQEGLDVDQGSKAKSEKETRSGSDHRSPYAQNSQFPHCQTSAKKNHPQGSLETISLLRQCQTSMNSTPLAKITCPNDNTQRHTHTPPTTKLCPKNIQSHSSNWSEKLITAAFQMDGKFNMWF